MTPGFKPFTVFFRILSNDLVLSPMHASEFSMTNDLAVYIGNKYSLKMSLPVCRQWLLDSEQKAHKEGKPESCAKLLKNLI